MKNRRLMNTIKETAKLAAADEIGLSESAIRRLVKDEAIPVLRIGNRAIINYEDFMQYVTSGYKAA